VVMTFARRRSVALSAGQPGGFPGAVASVDVHRSVRRMSNIPSRGVSASQAQAVRGMTNGFRGQAHRQRGQYDRRWLGGATVSVAGWPAAELTHVGTRLHTETK
jgi:hypothetical protein